MTEWQILPYNHYTPDLPPMHLRRGGSAPLANACLRRTVEEAMRRTAITTLIWFVAALCLFGIAPITPIHAQSADHMPILLPFEGNGRIVNGYNHLTHKGADEFAFDFCKVDRSGSKCAIVNVDKVISPTNMEYVHSIDSTKDGDNTEDLHFFEIVDIDNERSLCMSLGHFILDSGIKGSRRVVRGQFLGYISNYSPSIPHYHMSLYSDKKGECASKDNRIPQKFIKPYYLDGIEYEDLLGDNDYVGTLVSSSNVSITSKDTPVFRFPWNHNVTPVFTGGPHLWTGEARSGLDFSTGATATAILAMADGSVSFVGNETCRHPKGSLVKCKTVKISHAGGWETWYVHLSDFSPRLRGWRQGRVWRVRQGDWLGNEGSDGASSVHLHIELRRNGQPASWSEVSIEGWTAHTDCQGYNQQRNSRQNKAPCLATNYNGYLSKGDVQVIPQVSNSSYPRYLMASTNRARHDAYLTELPRTLVTRPGQPVTIRFTLQNIGPSDWLTNRRIALRRVAGNAPAPHDTLPLPKRVSRGQEMTWELSLKPNTPQVYVSTWQMTENGEPFGDPVIVVLHVLPETSADRFVGSLQALYDDARARLEQLYRENLDRFNEELERLWREAEERVREEERRQKERILGYCFSGIILSCFAPALCGVWAKRRNRRKSHDRH